MTTGPLAKCLLRARPEVLSGLRVIDSKLGGGLLNAWRCFTQRRLSSGLELKDWKGLGNPDGLGTALEARHYDVSSEFKWEIMGP